MRIALALAAALATALPSPTVLADASARFAPGMWEIKVHTRITGAIEMDDIIEENVECLVSTDELLGNSMGDNCTVTGRELGREAGWITFTCAYYTDGVSTTGTGRMDVAFEGERSDGTMTMRMSTPLGDLDVNGTIAARRLDDC